MVHTRMGQLDQALAYYHQALPLFKETNDHRGESITRYNMGMVFRALGRLREAVEELRRVVALDVQVHSRDLEADRALLAQVQAELEGS
jgi:tetratricopeptide (TPR) repeat protein